MKESARLLGMIHSTLTEYDDLPVGIGENFFKNMTPYRALESYIRTLENARKDNDTAIVESLEYRINLMERFPVSDINICNFTSLNTHGDYFIDQIICSEDRVKGIIDWTTACIHPVSWEIMRSYVYAEPNLADGCIELSSLICYIESYLDTGKLSKYDIVNMARLYFYQISVCDYYGQYYNSTSDNKDLFLYQAEFSTKLMKWFDKNLDWLERELELHFSYLE